MDSEDLCSGQTTFLSHSSVFITNKDQNRVDLINTLVSDCKDGYCTIRMFLEHGKKKVVDCPYGANCGGKNWCENREFVYDSELSERNLLQVKEIERFQYLDSLRKKRKESWNEAALHWADPLLGAAAIFSYAYDDLGIRDVGALDRLCAFAAEDTRPLLDRS